jgi:hypothetical protein
MSRKRSLTINDEIDVQIHSNSANDEPQLQDVTIELKEEIECSNDETDLGKHEFGELKEFPISQLHNYCSLPFIDEVYIAIQRSLTSRQNGGGNISEPGSNIVTPEQSKFYESKPIKLQPHISITGQNSDRKYKGGLFN